MMHNKFAICDGSYRGKFAVLTGSFNWTENADKSNAENFVIVRHKPTVDKFREEFARIWALNAPKGS
jgi:phosphatidylserine/phosphatidylglycerophosphate/cardiolipin synthase-like enzyme